MSGLFCQENSIINIHSLDMQVFEGYNAGAMYIATSLVKGVGYDDHSKL
jgi:hypothetical protein